ncbi:MAG TPA: zf-HC2 domain-containing protein [Bryobacteraceae bacterium]|jgi:hypothetical protein|nr:zf-HC2 domain-containing protein [Bryobacteraceae bacterium]
MSISCHTAKRHSAAYVDGRLRADRRSNVVAHLHHCEDCATYFEQISQLRAALKTVPERLIPHRLQTSLQVIASRQRAEVLATRGSHWKAIWDKWCFRINELMKPLAIPATGGLLSSLVLFGTFVFTISTTTRLVSYEVPLAYSSQTEANLIPVELGSHAVFLNMSIDSNGRTGDYAVSDPECKFRADLEAQPANIAMPSIPTVFAVAQPISGDIQIKFLPLAFRP